MASLLIKNADLVSTMGISKGDLLVEGGKIAKVAPNISETANRTIDAQGNYVFPGAIDPHVHLDMPFMGEVSSDDHETGTAAALAGGTTTVIDFIIPNRNQPLLEALKMWQAKAKKAVADYSFHMAVTWYNDAVGNEMSECVKQGITSFKIFLAYKGAIGVTETELLHTMKTVKKLNGLVNCHCENGEIIDEMQALLAKAGKLEPKFHELSRPSYVEGYGTHTAMAFAALTGCPVYVVHVTCKEAVEEIARARAKGLTVYGETCPQYLVYTDKVYDQPNFEGAKYVMSPPIRPAGHMDALWGALKSGTLQVVGTDHCPFNFKGQKELGRSDFRKIPNGGPGIEDRLKVMYTSGVLTGKLSMSQFVDVNCTKPAQIYGMYPQKGSLRIGADADLVIWDNKRTETLSAKTHHQRVDYNLFEGFKATGGPAVVISQGEIVFEQGKLTTQTGKGRFIKRAGHSPL